MRRESAGVGGRVVVGEGTDHEAQHQGGTVRKESPKSLLGLGTCLTYSTEV